jgi:hypothetical protein
VLHYYRSTVPVSECNNSYEECGARRPCGHWETARFYGGIKGGVKQRLRYTSGLGGLKNVVLLACNGRGPRRHSAESLTAGGGGGCSFRTINAKIQFQYSWRTKP